MKKTFKKAFAVIAAAASLAFGMTAVSANAADGTGNIKHSGTTYGKSYNSVSVGSVWVKSESSVGDVSEISVKITSYDGTISGTKSLTYVDSSAVSFSRSTTSTTKVSSYHSLKTYSGYTATGTLTVSR